MKNETLIKIIEIETKIYEKRMENEKDRAEYEYYNGYRDALYYILSKIKPKI